MYEENEDEIIESMASEIISSDLQDKNNMFNVSWVNVKSALISAFVTAVLGMAGYVIGVGDLFKLNLHALINVGALSALTAIVSILKAFLTTDKGEFMGVVKVHPAE